MRARIAIATSLVLTLLGAFAAGPAAAHHPTVTEFRTGLSSNGGPWDLADGGDGTLWFTENAASAFGPIGAGDGLISESGGLLTLAGNPKGITRGPHGRLWIVEAGMGGALTRVNDDGSVTEYNSGLTAGDPWDIAKGPDGNLWFVGRSPAVVGRITENGVITEFTTGLTANSQPSAITPGPDGSLWFTESADPGRIGRITTDGTITENSIGLPANMTPTDIVAGPDGNLWFTLSGGVGAIGRITPDGVFKIFKGGTGGSDGLTPNSRPTGITVGTDGALWFTEAGSPGRIGRITTWGEVEEFTDGLTPDRAPWMITPGPDGNMWFTENANPGAVARISLPPLVRDIGVRRVNTDTAIVTAIVSPNAQETELEAQYGAGESNRGGSTDSVSAGAGWNKAEVSLRIDGLRPGKTYRFRIAATNDSGTDVSQSREFTTNTLEPELAKTVVAEPTGRVRYKRPRGRWRRVAAGGIELPVGSSLDTRRGRIALTTALRKGKKQTGTFRGGIMQVRQPRRARGRVDIHLLGGNLAACGRSARSSGVGANAAYTRRERGRHLWGRDRGGRFRTFGRHSQATVRGTVWLTKDTCAGTLTVVKRGAVVVRDLRTHRRVLVKAGHRYLARARR